MEFPGEIMGTNLLRGDTEVFAYIVDRYKIQLYNLMHRYSNTKEDAADMTREVFCRAYERLNQYRKKNQVFPGSIH